MKLKESVITMIGRNLRFRLSWFPLCVNVNKINAFAGKMFHQKKRNRKFTDMYRKLQLQKKDDAIPSIRGYHALDLWCANITFTEWKNGSFFYAFLITKQ